MGGVLTPPLNTPLIVNEVCMTGFPRKKDETEITKIRNIIK